MASDGGETVIDWQPLVDAATQLVRALFDFMQEIRPEGGVIGPPYVHKLGPTRGPAFTVRDEFPRWEPPLPVFGTCVTPAKLIPVKGKMQEVPEAFRRRGPSQSTGGGSRSSKSNGPSFSGS